MHVMSSCAANLWLRCAPTRAHADALDFAAETVVLEVRLLLLGEQQFVALGTRDTCARDQWAYSPSPRARWARSERARANWHVSMWSPMPLSTLRRVRQRNRAVCAAPAEHAARFVVGAEHLHVQHLAAHEAAVPCALSSALRVRGAAQAWSGGRRGTHPAGRTSVVWSCVWSSGHSFLISSACEPKSRRVTPHQVLPHQRHRPRQHGTASHAPARGSSGRKCACTSSPRRCGKRPCIWRR
jgi:hypothetical protein